MRVLFSVLLDCCCSLKLPDKAAGSRYERSRRDFDRDRRADAGRAMKEFLISLAGAFLGSLLLLAAVYGVTTLIFAGVCLYYGLPLVLSLVPGLVPVGIVLAVNSSSLFD